MVTLYIGYKKNIFTYLSHVLIASLSYLTWSSYWPSVPPGQHENHFSLPYIRQQSNFDSNEECKAREHHSTQLLSFLHLLYISLKYLQLH